MLSPKEIGKRIKLSREMAEMSLNDVATRLGVNKTTILRYENGEIAKVKAPIIEELAAVLRVSPHYLMGWTDDPAVNPADGPVVDGVPLSNNECDLVMIFRQLDLLGQTAVVHKAMEEIQRMKDKK